MVLQQGPADTINYMIMGFAVILGTMAFFVLSLIIRFQNLRKDQTVLDEIEE
jgi:hypothetical protein